MRFIILALPALAAASVMVRQTTGTACGTAPGTITYCQGDQSCCVDPTTKSGTCCSDLIGQTCVAGACQNPDPCASQGAKSCGNPALGVCCHADQTCCPGDGSSTKPPTCCSSLLSQQCVDNVCVANAGPVNACGTTGVFCHADQTCCPSEDGLRAVCCDAHQANLVCRNAQCLASGGSSGGSGTCPGTYGKKLRV